jgi:hypothetical protein
MEKMRGSSGKEGRTTFSICTSRGPHKSRVLRAMDEYNVGNKREDNQRKTKKRSLVCNNAKKTRRQGSVLTATGAGSSL